jgi:NADPH-dependent glutamate synthase beta subunit-like oxidoreductase
MVQSVSPPTPHHIVAIVGGATAGAEAAGILADHGVVSVVFEQNDRPYGKIEDGLPRWHVKLRQKEYETIDEHLGRPEVLFVPRTKIGKDVDFRSLVGEWGFTAVLLAHGAWRDRPLPIEGAEAYLGRGLVYQNSFIYWFNHFTEQKYDGPQYEIADGAVVVGGGLASIDVMKALQIEAVRRALAGRGIVEEMLRLEHEGIPAVLAAHGLTWEALGLRGATLYYRRRIEDMPLAEPPEGADEARRQRFEATRRKILEKAMQKYCFAVRPLLVPVGLVVERDRLVGLRFQHTRVEGGKAVPIPGEVEEVRAPLVISSIGSIPEPMPGIEQDGLLYHYVDPALGRLAGYDTVFSTGNVVTGKGNILDSRRHSVRVTAHLVERFLGLDGAHGGEEALLDPHTASARATGAQVAAWAASRPPLAPERAQEILRRVHTRQHAVGYEGSYAEWIQRVTPHDLA